MSSVLAPGRGPTDDGQLIRSFHDRIRALESATTTRVGPFVISADGANLVADAPGIDRLVFGDTPDYTAQFQSMLSSSLSSYISASDLAKSLGAFSDVVSTSTPNSILQQITEWALNIVQNVTGWASAFGLTGVTSPEGFVRLLTGLFPAVQPAVDGALLGLDLPGLVDNLNGTWSYINSQAQNGVSNLIQQPDGTIISQAQAIQHMANSIIAAGATNMGAAAAAGQQIADHGIAALQGLEIEAAQTGQQIAEWGTQFSTALTGWFNALGGTQAPIAGAPALTQAQKDMAERAAQQASLTAAIQAQLPHLYGSRGGTSGLSDQVTMSGTLDPALTQILPGWAKYTAPFVGDSQTVSAVWNAVDGFGKFLWLRGSADGTYRVYAKFKSGTNKSEIGYYAAGVKHVFPGGTFTLPGAGNHRANGNYQFQATDYQFTVTGPGGLSFSCIDSLHDSYKGPLYVYGGFGTEGQAMALTSYLTPGTPTFAVPGTMTTGDWFIIGVLGSGAGGSYYPVNAYGFEGGGSSAWVHADSLVLGTDIPLTTTGFAVTVPAGGIGGHPDVDYGNGIERGVSGATTVVAIPGYGTVNGPGGLFDARDSFYGGTGSGSGLGAASGGSGDADIQTDLTVNGITFAAAPADNYYGDVTGYSPGGGGIAGSPSVNGFASSGGSGGAYIQPVNVTTALPNGVVSFAIFDSGPSTGPSTSYVAAPETTASTTYVDLASADGVTVNIGTSGMALVFNYSRLENDTNFAKSFLSFAVSGATSIAADDNRALELSFAISNGVTVGALGAPHLVPNLNAGANTFKPQARVDSGIGTFTFRRLAVIPL